MIVLYILLGLLSFILLLLLVLLCMASCHRKKQSDMALLLKTRYAHRGLHDDTLPENSLAAIKKAAEKEYGIEFDLHLTADGALAVVHDDTLTRTCGVDLKVNDTTLEALRRHPLSDGSPIPCFEEVLQAVNGSVPLLIELKNDGNNGKILVKRTLEALEGYKGAYCIESFDPRVLLALKKQAPRVIRGQLCCNFMKEKRMPLHLRLLLSPMLLNAFTKPDFVAYRLEDQKSLPLRAAKAAGTPLFFWTVKNKNAALAEINKGSAVIFEGFDFYK
ncbi:MAG: glycerophosphodiester phosphodiesterase [Clostridia bacterium]|nr:glycerophosphodiester phosphodiesterase [Clostridia bacterium]